MGRYEKKSYLEAIRGRYQKSNKAQKATILNEFCEVCGYNRKYAIRILCKVFKRRKSKHKARLGRPCYQKKEIIKILQTIWLATDRMCSK